MKSTKYNVINLLTLLLLFPFSIWAQIPGQSHDGLWSIVEVDPSTFPEGFDPPSEFVALSLDNTKLEKLLENAPREHFGLNPPNVFISIPLPGGLFSNTAVSKTFLMEPALANQFPQIQTFVFADEFGGVSGHMAQGPGGFYFAAISEQGQLIHIEPTQTASGLIYLSYFDHNRTDGANDETTIHPATAGDGDIDPVPVPLAASSHDHEHGLSHDHGLPIITNSTSVSGDQLRIYRLAMATTAEFYQARGGNDLSVLFSLIVDLLGANAVFESEVATRLIVSLASLDLFYDDPMTAPYFNAPPQCSVSQNSCASDSDCDTDNGETCNVRTTCGLRDDNRDNLIALHGSNTVTHDQYDLSVLFAVSRPGVRGGCAWYVVCLEGNTNHKARGMVTAGGGGTGSTSGVLAHEVGHMLGARHTFTGQDGSCTLNEFLAGNSESGYEPGSGTTRMSYAGNCATDNVDTSNDAAADQYFHSRSIDEIVENVFSGDGASCGSLVNTGNQAPVVDAGQDYTIPRQTPFKLTPESYFDEQPLTFNWEQYDRAFFPRPIDTDFISIFGIPDFGPIIRSVPPGDSPSRIVPNLPDLLDGTSQPPLSINRAGEMLPQVDRELNFRFIARDGQMAGGGVAYDDMAITVDGDPFFITSPNSGSLQAGCNVPVTWEIGGGDVAANVDISYSITGGLDMNNQESFPEDIVLATPNDGEYTMTMPCDPTNQGRLKVMASDNIFFDVNDNDLSISNDLPVATIDPINDGEVDEMCQFTLNFTASVSDSCGVDESDVGVLVQKLPPGSFTLGVPSINKVQNGVTQVDIIGSVLVSDLLNSSAVVEIEVNAEDNCGATDDESLMVEISDTIPPQIDASLSPNALWPPNHKMQTIQASVVATDNCPGVSYVLSDISSDQPDNGIGDGNTVNDIQNAQIGTPDLEFDLRAERGKNKDGRTYTATYTATDGSGNTASSSPVVTVAHDQGN